MGQNALTQLIGNMKQHDPGIEDAASQQAFSQFNNLEPVKAVDFVHFIPNPVSAVWLLDDELLSPLFNMMEHGNWNCLLSGLKSGGGPRYALPAGDLGYLSNFLLLCCMRVICIQGHTETSESKEALTSYLRKSFDDSDANTEASGPRALCPFDIVNGHHVLGTVVVNMLSDLIALRQKSTDDLGETQVPLNDLANLLWVEASTVTSEAIRILIDGDYPVPKDDTGEIIGSTSLEPYGNFDICREFISMVYSMPQHTVSYNAAFGPYSAEMCQEANFALCVGILAILKYLCGEITPGMLTELFADECDECDRCRISYYRRHIFFMNGVEQGIQIPHTVFGYTPREPERYYPLFTAITLCRNCPKDEVEYTVGVKPDGTVADKNFQGELIPEPPSDEGYDWEGAEAESTDTAYSYRSEPLDSETTYEQQADSDDDLEEQEVENSYSDGYMSSSGFYRKDQEGEHTESDTDGDDTKDADDDEPGDEPEDVVKPKEKPMMQKPVNVSKPVKQPVMVDNPFDPVSLGDMNDTVDEDISKLAENGALEIDLESGFAPSDFGSEEDELKMQDRIG